jgi:NADPH-dependent glutamate synthase beta subunit-like oxidoreductase
VRGWLNIVRGLDKPVGDMPWQEYAFRRMTEANPFPAIMGRVCPAPCQSGCNRNEVEDFVGINSIEHYIGNWAIENKLAFEKPTTETGKKVAIIGGGPAGLSVAYHLRRKGHSVTIFDDHEKLGGMMRYGIPGYRTPRDVIDAEIERILDMGVMTRMNCKVGKDVTIDDLRKEFDAFFWGLGAQSGNPLEAPGGNALNVVTGVAFLRAFNEGRLQHLSGRVLVIGGGDTAMDVASVARRLGHITQVHEDERPENVILGQTAHDVASIAKREGAADVEIVYRRPISKMPAAKHEVDSVQKEGVAIRENVIPLEAVIGADGRARALKVCPVEWVDGKMVKKEDQAYEIEATLIVAATGQGGDFSGIEYLNNGKGSINTDKLYRAAGKKDEWAGGDILKPHLLTTAIGHGRISAESIDTFLAGQELSRRPKVDVHQFKLLDELKQRGLSPEKAPAENVYGTDTAKFSVHNFEDRAASEIITHEDLFLSHFPYNERHIRSEVHVGADNVVGNFDERLQQLSEVEAIAEAKRCMSCGLCFECDNCLVFCPQSAVKRTKKSEKALGRYVFTEYDKCVGCQICADVCPTGYIQMGLGE